MVDSAERIAIFASEISRLRDRALNFSALWIGGMRLNQPYAE